MSRLRTGLLSILATLIPTLGLAMTGYAGEDNPYTILIPDTAAGRTYAAYKVFDRSTVPTNEEATASRTVTTIREENPWYGIVSRAVDVFSLTPEEDPVRTVTLSEGASAARAVSVFADADLPKDAVPAGQVTVPAEEGGDAAGSRLAVITLKEQGVYYVTTAGGSLICVDDETPAVEIREKGRLPLSARAGGGTCAFSLCKTGSGLVLKGAVFSLYRTPADAEAFENALHFTVDETQSFYEFYDGAQSADTTRLTTEIRAGDVRITGLPCGVYYLVELQAPSGYQRLKTPMVVVLTGDSLYTGTYGSDHYEEQMSDAIMIENYSGFVLPSTGGKGTRAFTVAGILLLAAAILSHFFQKKNGK